MWPGSPSGKWDCFSCCVGGHMDLMGGLAPGAGGQCQGLKTVLSVGNWDILKESAPTGMEHRGPIWKKGELGEHLL